MRGTTAPQTATTTTKTSRWFGRNALRATKKKITTATVASAFSTSDNLRPSSSTGLTRRKSHGGVVSSDRIASESNDASAITNAGSSHTGKGTPLQCRGGRGRIIARMSSAASSDTSSQCTISQELANLEQEFRDMLDPDSDSKPRAADVRAMRSRINALKREVANGNGANIIQSQTKTRAPDAKEIARKELERLREEREKLLKMRAQVEENERLKKKNSNKGTAVSNANNVEPEHDNPVTTTTTQKPKPADERKARVAHMEAEKHKEDVDVVAVVMDDEMKALLAKEEQARKEAEELEASRLMAEAEEAKYAAYLEESGDFLNTNSGIRSGINDPFLDRAFIVEKLESELLENLEMQSDLRAIEDIGDQLESQKKEAEEAERAKAEAESARQLAEAKQKAKEEEARLIVEKQQKEARANAEKIAAAQAELKAMEAETKRLQKLAEEKKQGAAAAEVSQTTIESPGSQAIRDLLEKKQAEAAKIRQLGMVEDELAKREVAEAAKKNKAIREAKEAEELAAKKVAEAEAELKRKAEEEEEAKRAAEVKKMEEAKKAKETLMRLKQEAEELKAAAEAKKLREEALAKAQAEKEALTAQAEKERVEREAREAAQAEATARAEAEARAIAEAEAQAQAEAERKALERQLQIEELAREEQAKADAAKAKADAEYAKAEERAKKLQEKTEILNDNDITHLRAKYEELARESEASPGAKRDWAEAMKIAGDKVRCMEQHSHGQAPKNDSLWTVSPAMPVPGQSVTVSYCNQNTVLNGRPKVFAHFGTNQWSSGAEQFEMRPRTPAVAGDSAVWFDLEVSVPSKAVILDFVFSDGNGTYDNNNRGDFHVPIAGANEMLERSRIESCIKIYAKLRLEREEEDRLEELRQAERTKLKEIAKVKAAELTAKQRAHVLFTIPEFPKAGEPFKLCYNPKNTNLRDAMGVSVVGGWNRWNHEQALPMTKMSPDPSCKADSKDYFSVELTAPKDAFMFDFVFCDQDGNNYDNRNRLDYHLPITGGINADGSKAVEKPMHVMSVAVEMAPIAKVGGLGDVVTSLSLAVEAEGHRVEVVLPKYDCMKYDLIDDLKEEQGFEWGGTYNHVYSGTVEGVKTFFIDPDNGMFKVGMVYGTDYLSIPMTDQERFGFFSKAALEWMLQSGRNPDIIHIHDWQTAPVAKFLAEDYAPYGLDNPKVIFTIHNLHYGQALIADAMHHCAIATTVSRTYAKEIAHEGCVNPNLHKLHGVVNGIDPDIWDPRNDKFLPQFFGEDEVIPGKAAARQALCSRSNLYNNPDVPMIGVVTRLTHQKGIHLIKRAIYRALERGCQVCLLGSAPDEKVQREFEDMAHQLKQNHYNTAALHLFYDETMSHFIYAGADMILVPSMFEPCGLSQLIAMRYGTVPVVRRTGGLADTVFDVEHDHAKAAWEGMTPNGFSFDGTDEGSIDYALDRGIDMFYNDIDAFRKLQANCMSQDWSWNRPAIEYIELFHAARKA